jgi:hypothetical protein
VIVGSVNSISAPTPQTISSTDYFWKTWSDGGAQSHDLTAGTTPKTYTARYCPEILFSPVNLPAATLGKTYHQTISVSGAATPVDFDITSGSLPPGLTLSASGVLSGTPSVPGNFQFTVTATDANACKESQNYSLNLAALLLDDFNSNTVTWDVIKGTWAESNGKLGGVATGKGITFAPIPWDPSGKNSCTQCDILVEDVQTAGGDGSNLTIIGWYVDSKNKVELIFKELDKVILKQRSAGTIVTKEKVSLPINPGSEFDVLLRYQGTKFEVFINGAPVLSVDTTFPPNGKVGFSLKRTSGSFGRILVN